MRLTLDKHNPAQKAVEGIVNAPPTHADGRRVIVGDAPTGAFDGHAKDIAWSYDDTWYFDTPEEGWTCMVGDVRYEYRDTDWRIGETSRWTKGSLAGVDDISHVEHPVRVSGASARGLLIGSHIRFIGDDSALKIQMRTWTGTEYTEWETMLQVNSDGVIEAEDFKLNDDL